MALTDVDHEHYAKATQWLDGPGHSDWGVCALTGAGLLRLLTNPKIGSLSVKDASRVLAALIDHPGYRFWSIKDDWTMLAAPFMERVFGHQQITGAYLLGLAIKEGGTLVTMDKGMRYLAGTEYSRHVLILE